MFAQFRRDLEAQVRTQAFETRMEKMRVDCPAMAKYSSIAALVVLVEQGNPEYEEKDAVLHALIAEVRKAPTLFPILNLMFWDRMVGLFEWRRRNAVNRAELFGRIQAEFFDVVTTYPLDRRPRKIDVNILLDTKNRVIVWQQRESAREEHHECLPIDEGEVCRRLADFQESEVFPEEMEAYLLAFVRLCIIDERQYDLLVETNVHKRMTQKEWAEARGVGYDLARQLHHRAERAIKECEKGRREK